MISRKLRTLVVACGVSVVLLAACAESKACALFDSLFGCGSRTTYKVVCPAPACPPTFAPSPCTSCPAPTDRYVPQTTYRPVISLTRQTTLVPYRSYRVPYATYRAPYATYRVPYTNSCNSCGGTVSYGGAVSYGGVVGSSCSGCNVGTVSSPAVSYGGSTPAASGSGGGSSMSTFQKTEKPPIEEEEALKPIPNRTEEETDADTGPDLAKPISRTTSLPVVRATYYRPAPAQAAPATTKSGSMIGVWRASKD
ncbi:MAG: hypothetical protein HQ567_12095 [Candidatus Nealsonbacteria bacterium]|nr:hypothetical protein [Candidatus Nealsonbacteria bacterium]